MRRVLALGFSLALCGWLLGPEGHAQSGGVAAGSAGGRVRAAGSDPSRPYGTRDFRALAEQKQVYSRPKPSSPSPPPQNRARAAVFSNGVRDYFPGTRPGQSPNRNVVDPRTLCVPGRRALIQR